MEKETITTTVTGTVEKSLEVDNQKLKVVSFKTGVYLNDKLLGLYDEITDSLLSPSGKIATFITRPDGHMHLRHFSKHAVSVVSVDTNIYAWAIIFGFSPDEQCLLWAAIKPRGRGADIYLGGLQLGTTEAALSIRPVYERFAYAFSPNNQTVAWVEESSQESGYSTHQYQRLIINDRPIYTIQNDTSRIKQLLWLKDSRLLILEYGGKISALSIGQNKPNELLNDDFVRIVATPENTNFAAVKKQSIGGGYYQYIIVYNNHQYRLRKQMGDGYFRQTQIKFDKNKLVFLYPNDEKESIKI